MDNIQDIAQGMQELKIEAISCTFPQEIIREILLKLPIKSLIKYTSVCKAWRSMIINQSFIRTHLSPRLSPTVYVNNLNDSHLFLIHRVAGTRSITMFHKALVDDVLEEVYSLHHDNQAFDEYSKIEFPIGPTQELYNRHLRVVGTCNGLICLADDIFRYGYNIFIWNPAIRKLVTLPCPGVTYMTHGGYNASIGFGFDANTNDYKVVRLVTLLDMCDDSTTVAEVYSIATGTWTSLNFVSPSCIFRGGESQAFLNGALHWPVLRWTDYGNEYFILTFDVRFMLFREMPVPKSLIYDFELGLRLSVLGDGKSIALFSMDNRCEDRFLDIWVMKEYGIKESWTKLITLGPQGPERLLPRALCFRKSGEVLLMLCGAREEFSDYDYTLDNYHIKSKHELVSLDLVNKTVKNLGVPGEGYQYCSVDSFKEVLVLLDQADAVSY